MASTTLKKQMCYALGTLAGWALARSVQAKEAVPYTILGGLAGAAVGEGIYGAENGRPLKLIQEATDRNGQQLSGVGRKARPKAARRRKKNRT